MLNTGSTIEPHTHMLRLALFFLYWRFIIIIINIIVLVRLVVHSLKIYLTQQNRDTHTQTHTHSTILTERRKRARVVAKHSARANECENTHVNLTYICLYEWLCGLTIVYCACASINRLVSILPLCHILSLPFDCLYVHIYIWLWLWLLDQFNLSRVWNFLGTHRYFVQNRKNIFDRGQILRKFSDMTDDNAVWK